VWAGLWLLIAPWTALWDRNYFARVLPLLGTLMSSPYARGAVTGVGLVTMAAGVRELFGVFVVREPPPDPPDNGISGA
jgi:hypothetical protein